MLRDIRNTFQSANISERLQSGEEGRRQKKKTNKQNKKDLPAIHDHAKIHCRVYTYISQFKGPAYTTQLKKLCIKIEIKISKLMYSTCMFTVVLKTFTNIKLN